MKMKKIINIKCLALMLGLFAMTASCTNDDLTNGETKDNKQTDGTVFVGGKSSASAGAKSRTGFDYNYSKGANSKFFWTAGDKVYLADGTASQPWGDTSMWPIQTADVADFIFRGKNFTEPSYDIYYPGKNATAYNKVNIVNDNGTYAWNKRENGDFYNIFDDDCGYAKAIRKPDGKYYFELEHLSAFLYLLPYAQAEASGYFYIPKRIKITADTNIAGEFTITPTGLTGTGSSNFVASNFFGIGGLTGTANGVWVDGSQKYRDYGYFMFHIAPTTTKLKIEYNFSINAKYADGYSNSFVDRKIDKVFIKEIPQYTYKKNTVTPITSRIALPMYEPKFYTWDAAEGEDYLKGYEDQIEYWYIPTLSNDKVPNVYNRLTDRRYYNPTTGVATRSGKNLPNMVEATWYASHGDPHFDEQYLWENGHVVYCMGMWVKKKSEIPGFSSTNLPSDVTFSHNYYVNSSVAQGTPNDTSKYFFLPLQGAMEAVVSSSSDLEIGLSGKYWTKTSLDSKSAWYLGFAKSGIYIRTGGKEMATPLWNAQ